jgi:hypothetical protein
MSPQLEQVLQEVERLTPEERLELVQRVVEGLRKPAMPNAAKPVKHRISEFYGIASGLLPERDAQEWVNELRENWSEREAQWSQPT